MTNDEIAQLAAAHSLHGNEDGLLAGCTFDSGSLPKILSQKVTLPSAEDIPEYVNNFASHPVPVHFVEVSSNRDGAADSAKMEIRPSKVQTRPPFAAGEWWQIIQGWEDPNGSHNGTAAYCWDCHRINGPTFGAKIFAAAAGKVIGFDTGKPTGDMCVFHALRERAVYMHIKDDSFAKFFPNATSPPPDGIIPVGSQPAFKARDPIVDVGHHPPVDHLHFEGAANIEGQTFSHDPAIAGAGVPAALSDFFRSRDAGKSWEHVSLGIPEVGEVIAFNPFSPWSDKGDPLSVAPAAASWGPDRLDVFAKGENDRLWHKLWNGERYDNWVDLGGSLTSAPAAVSWGPDRIDVFARGHDFRLKHKLWNGERWDDWVDLDVRRLTSAPAATSWGPHRLDVFALGENGHVLHKRWNGEDWDDWFDLGGSPTSAPAAISWGLRVFPFGMPGRIDVFVRGHDFHTNHKVWNGEHWDDWFDIDIR